MAENSESSEAEQWLATVRYAMRHKLIKPSTSTTREQKRSAEAVADRAAELTVENAGVLQLAHSLKQGRPLTDSELADHVAAFRHKVFRLALISEQAGEGNGISSSLLQMPQPRQDEVMTTLLNQWGQLSAEFSLSGKELRQLPILYMTRPSFDQFVKNTPGLTQDQREFLACRSPRQLASAPRRFTQAKALASKLFPNASITPSEIVMRHWKDPFETIKDAQRLLAELRQVPGLAEPERQNLALGLPDDPEKTAARKVLAESRSTIDLEAVVADLVASTPPSAQPTPSRGVSSARSVPQTRSTDGTLGL